MSLSSKPLLAIESILGTSSSSPKASSPSLSSLLSDSLSSTKSSSITLLSKPMLTLESLLGMSSSSPKSSSPSLSSPLSDSPSFISTSSSSATSSSKPLLSTDMYSLLVTLSFIKSLLAMLTLSPKSSSPYSSFIEFSSPKSSLLGLEKTIYVAPPLY